MILSFWRGGCVDIGSIRLIFTEKKRDNPQCFLYKTSIKSIFNLIGRTKKVRSINIYIY